MYYIGIDLGTSAVKLLMTLKDGTVLSAKDYVEQYMLERTS